MLKQHDFKKFPELTNSQMAIFYFDSPHKQITEDFRARVVKVTDGDTVRLECDFRDFSFPLRLAEIAAPELNEPMGNISQKWLENQILNKMVDVIINKNNRVEKYGRLVGEIIYGGLNIGELSKLSNMSISFEEQSSNIIKDVDDIFVNKFEVKDLK